MGSRIAPALLVTTTAAILLFAPAPADAGGFAISILGGRRTGMLTNLAAPDDPTALFHNPAGLADLPGTRLHLSGSTAFLSTTFTLQELDPARFWINEEGCDARPLAADQHPCAWPVDDEGYYAFPIAPVSTFGVLPYVGISQDLGFIHPDLEQVVLSAAATAPNLYGASLPADAPTAYFFIEGYFITVSPMVGVGWRINDWIAVGGNVMYNYLQLKYSQKFSMMDLLVGEDPDFAEAFAGYLAQTEIGDLRLDYAGEDHGMGWTLSVLINPTDWLAFGITYNHALPARFDGEVGLAPVREDVTQEELAELIDVAGYLLPERLIVEMTIPPSLQAGVNVKLTPFLEIGMDWRFWFYNVYQHQVMIPVYPEGTTWEERPLTELDLTKKKNYGVSFEAAIGVLYRPLATHPELELMAGFGFDLSPVPDETFSIDSPSMHQIVVTGGIRWAAVEGFRASISYMYLGYFPRDITTSLSSPPLNARGVGNNHLPRLELEYVF